MTMDRNALGHTLVRFYLSHGSVLPLLDALNMREIYQTGKGTSCQVRVPLVGFLPHVVLLAVLTETLGGGGGWGGRRRRGGALLVCT